MKNKKLIGIILAVLFLLLLYYTSLLINNNFDGALGYMMISDKRIDVSHVRVEEDKVTANNRTYLTADGDRYYKFKE